MKQHCLSNLSHGRKVSGASVLVLLAIAGAVSASAAPITGVVTNGTTHQPAAGDQVVLIALSRSMQEIAKTTTDAKGHFSIESPDPGMHLLRVDHQGAAYFQPAPPNTPNVDIPVYDVAKIVQGVTTEANVLRVETDQQGLQVTELFFIKNVSDPPRTQFSDHSYEIYLPPGAQLDGSAAMGPGGMPVQASPIPLADKNHFAFTFPLRPGESRFQLQYHVPYSGNLALKPRLATPAANFVVIMPKSMTFKPGPGTTFQPIDQPAGAQTYLARNVNPSQSLAFTISGSGSMPRDTQSAEQNESGPNAAGPGANAGQGAPNQAATDTRPGIGLGNPIDTPDPLNKYKWWILGGIALVFAIAAGFLLRKPVEPVSDHPLPSRTAAPAAGTGPDSLLKALKDELFALESDRVQGKVSEAEYGELKSALELVLRRALGRQAA
jgi:hypothetical protein